MILIVVVSVFKCFSLAFVVFSIVLNPRGASLTIQKATLMSFEQVGMFIGGGPPCAQWRLQNVLKIEKALGWFVNPLKKV